MCEIDGEFAQAYSTERVVSRKPHRCDGCRACIVKGEEYERHWSLSDGAHYHAKLCLGCAVIREEFGEAHRFHPWPEALEESLRECVEEDNRPEWRNALAWMLKRRRADRTISSASKSEWGGP